MVSLLGPETLRTVQISLRLDAHFAQSTYDRGPHDFRRGATPIVSTRMGRSSAVELLKQRAAAVDIEQ
jgi:hypothetical protein